MESELTQPIINIDLLGHVANGKSSLVRAVTGEKTARGDSRCMQTGESREMTIQIGYSNAKIYQCGHCPKPDCYTSIEGSKKQIPPCDNCGEKDAMKLVQYVSFVDCFDPDTAVMMADGSSRQIKDICPNEKVMGDDGTARTVLSVQTGQKCLYRIKYTTQIKNKVEKQEFVCTEGHLLVLRIDTPVRTPAKRSNGKYSVEYYTVDLEKTVHINCNSFNCKDDAQDFYEKLDKSPVIFETTVVNYLQQLPVRLHIRCCMFRAETLEFDQGGDNLAVGKATSEEIAWLIGLWLADGKKTCSRITVNADKTEIIDRINDIASKANWTVSCYDYNDRNAKEIYIGKNYMQKDSFTCILRRLGVLDRKHIPQSLKFSPSSIRYNLLSGLNGKGEFEIVKKKGHYQLACDINWV